MRIVTILALLFLSVVSVQAEQRRFFVGAGGGLSTLSGGDSAYFYMQPSYAAMFGGRLSDRWSLRFTGAIMNMKNDTTNPGAFAFSGDKNHATREFRATRLLLTLDRKFFEPSRFFNVSLGAGPGLLMWKMQDDDADTTLKVTGAKLESNVDYAGSELLLNLTGTALLQFSSSLALQWHLGMDYLTGAGTNFESAVDSRRQRSLFSTLFFLSWHFGRTADNPSWNSDTNWKRQPVASTRQATQRPDSDGDGVPDAVDECNDTPAGIAVNQNGCPRDTDHDGVPDDIDDCPSTDRLAAGYVDIRGCALDSDFDGIPDYRDPCPNNPVGALVDSVGCPIDTDADGVPDGLDDCPSTFPGLEVDQHGCLDLGVLSKPLVLYIEYQPGGFEVDPRSKERIRRLARLLTFAPDVRIEINAYTDDIGTTEANASLSKKRADRVRGFLVNEGVKADRITTVGRGEVSFIASNETAEGRAKNRRIEILFLR
jgi:OOP family OmpA-OmpF porin